MKQAERGRLTAVVGAMFCGKTLYLLEEYKKDSSDSIEDSSDVLAFKPSLDNRYSEESHLHSHNGKSVPAILYSNDDPSEIVSEIDKREGVRKVLLDEVMFSPQDVIGVINEILDRGIDVVAAGLDYTDKLEPFGVMPEIVEMADEVVRLQSVCDGCARHTGVYSYSKFEKDQKVVVAGADMYGAACKDCHPMLQGESLRLKEMGVEFEYPRREQERSPGVYRIEVGGDTMRVGKTTALDVISRGLEKSGLVTHTTYEEWEGNEYLKESYQVGSEGWVESFMNSQDWFGDRKFENVKRAQEEKSRYAKEWKKGMAQHAWLQDVYPEMDWNYPLSRLMLGQITPKELKEYREKQIGRDWSKAPFPDLLVYIRMPRSDRMLERSMPALREFEDVSEDYLLTMRRLNQRWIAGAQRVYGKRVLIVDSDDFDFANDESQKGKLVGMVRERLGL